MNETTLLLLLMIGPLSKAPDGVGTFSLTVAEANRVQVFQGSVEYQRKDDEKEFACRLEFASETTLSASSDANSKKLETVIIVHASSKESVASNRNFPGAKDYVGPFNFGPMLLNPKELAELKTIEGSSSRKQGVLEPTTALFTVEKGKDGDRVTCFSVQDASPSKNSWIKSPHVISAVFKWGDAKPDPKRLVVPEAEKK